MTEPLIPKHGGYRRLKSFQVAQLVHDITARFCDRYIDIRSRTHDQMIQAARSGVQNIAEGSQASGTSKKFELKLTNVARASLEELRLDYEDFLRQRGLAQWDDYEPLGRELVQARCESADEVADWVRGVHDRLGASSGASGSNESSCLEQTSPAGPAGCPGETGRGGRTGRTGEAAGPILGEGAAKKGRSYPEIAANAALVLINVACALLDRQIKALAEAFENEGGFTERLYWKRKGRR